MGQQFNITTKHNKEQLSVRNSTSLLIYNMLFGDKSSHAISQQNSEQPGKTKTQTQKINPNTNKGPT